MLKPEDFEKKVADFCLLHSLFLPGTGGSVLVALSGGGDSVAMLAVLLRLGSRFGFTVEAAHLNHALRGGESLDDERFVKEFCDSLGVFLTIERLNEGALAAKGMSIETAARGKRLDFLERTASSRGMSRIATGHTLDDQAETVLQRILRGTGPSGLAGILPMRGGLWIRPLLQVTRKEAREYLKSAGYTFREDSSNADTAYFRNRIRHELLPFLEERFSPGIRGGLTRLAELSRVQESFLDRAAEEAFEGCRIAANPYKILLDNHKLMEYHKVVKQRVIRRCLEGLEGEGRDSDMVEVERVLDVFNAGSGSLDVTSAVRCGSGGGFAAFVKRSGSFEPLLLRLPGETFIPMGGGRIVAEASNGTEGDDGVSSVVVDGTVIDRYGALSVGPVKRGELMTPFGMKGKTKIRGIVAASSLPAVVRDTVPVLRAGAVPVWVPGFRASEELRMPVNDTNTGNRNAFRLTFKDGIGRR